MTRTKAIETSSVLVAAGAIMALALDARAGGIGIDLVGWVLMGLGIWSLMLFALVGTTATTAVSTTFVGRNRPTAVRRVVITRATTRNDLSA
jgi:hypothetical protein